MRGPSSGSSGRRFTLKGLERVLDIQSARTFPPLHPRCRCAAVFSRKVSEAELRLFATFAVIRSTSKFFSISLTVPPTPSLPSTARRRMTFTLPPSIELRGNHHSPSQSHRPILTQRIAHLLSSSLQLFSYFRYPDSNLCEVEAA